MGTSVFSSDLEHSIQRENHIIKMNDRILVTGANGFIGSRVVKLLLSHGFSNIRCFVRPSGNLTRLREVLKEAKIGAVETIEGNLLSRDDCNRAARDVKVIFHLAAGIEKTF